MRLDRASDLDELVHQLLVDVQAAGGVDDQHVLALGLGLVERPRGDVDRVALGALLVDVGADLLADLDELVDRGRAVDVAGGDRDRRAVLALAGSARAWPWRSSCPSPAGRPSGSPSADAARTPARAEAPPISSASSSLTILTTCWPGLSVADHVGAEAALLDRRRELLDDLEVDVGLEQREADLAHRGVDVVLGQRAAAADVGERGLELLGEGVEH